jgi:hypothetical protein
MPTEEEVRLLDEMRMQVETGLDGGPVVDRDLVRFLRARKCNVKAALKQYAAARKWRAETVMAVHTQQAPGPFGAQAAADAALHDGGVEKYPMRRLLTPDCNAAIWLHYAPMRHAGHAKDGLPLCIIRSGTMTARFGEMCKRIGDDWKEKLKLHLFRTQFELQAARCREASQARGIDPDGADALTRSVFILDLKSSPIFADMRLIWWARELFALAPKMYPETVGVIFMINAPGFFAALWKLLKGAVDPTTASKLHILTTNYAPTLLSYIDADQLPVEYGGTASFSGVPHMASTDASQKEASQMYGDAVALAPILDVQTQI